MRFLFAWQRVDPEHRAAGLEGLASVIEQLDGFEVPAAAWESDVLSPRGSRSTTRPARHAVSHRAGGVGPAQRDGGAAGTAPPIRSTPIALFLRESMRQTGLGEKRRAALQLRRQSAGGAGAAAARRSSTSWRRCPASSPTQVEQALGELAGLGLVTSDSFAGLRALITPSSKRKPLGGVADATGPHRSGSRPRDVGRWWTEARSTSPVELAARSLLRRYGVVFKRLLAREAGAPPWRELVQAYRRLEAQGRDSRRPVRRRHVGRAVRAARSRGSAPRSASPAGFGTTGCGSAPRTRST